MKFVFYSVLCYKSEMSLFVNYRKVDFDLFCYILFSDPLSHISASQHHLTPCISCCSWSEFHSPTHSFVTDGILVWSVTSFYHSTGQFRRRKHFKNSGRLKLPHITGMEHAQIENFISFLWAVTEQGHLIWAAWTTGFLQFGIPFLPRPLPVCP